MSYGMGGDCNLSLFPRSSEEKDIISGPARDEELKGTPTDCRTSSFSNSDFFHFWLAWSGGENRVRTRDFWRDRPAL